MRCQKKRHGHNFDFSGLKRIAGLVHSISYPTYSFQPRKIKIVAVSFFLTPPNFRDTSTFADMIWLWPAITPVKKIARPKSTTFSESSGSQLSHGPILEKFSHQKISRRRVFSKKRRFLQLFVSAPRKISNGCQSDNFDARRSAHGSSESSCPKFSETHAEKVSIFKIVGASPLQSQVIQNHVRQNRWFSGNFWEKILSHGQTVHFRHHFLPLGAEKINFFRQ